MQTIPSKPLPELSPSDIARFWSHVAVGAPDACWPWKAGRFKGGYGQFKVHGRSIKTHRIAFRLFHGVDAVGQLIRHTCDNPPCCNGRHMIAGNATENAADAIERSRFRPASGERHGSRTHPERTARGERVGGAKLTEDQVKEIRALYAGGGITQAAMGQRFGVKRETIGRITRGQNWFHVAAQGERISLIDPKRRGKAGAGNNSAILTEDDVRNIRALRLAGKSATELASRFGVTKGTVYHVLQGRTWSHVR